MKVYITGSSKKPRNKLYTDAANSVALFIENSNFDTVFDLSDLSDNSRGLMLDLYKHVKYSNCKRIYAVTNSLSEEILDENIQRNNIYVYKNLAEKNNILANIADMIIVLPGGIETVDEIMAFLHSKMCKEHNKKIILYNVNGYFTNFLDSIAQMCSDGFVNFSDIGLISVCKNIDEISKTVSTVK